MDKLKFVNDVVNVVMHINGGAISRNGIGHPTAFLYFNGHIATLEVEVHEDGWVSGSNVTKSFHFSLDHSYISDERLQRELDKLRAYAFYLKFKRREKK